MIEEVPRSEYSAAQGLENSTERWQIPVYIPSHQADGGLEQRISNIVGEDPNHLVKVRREGLFFSPLAALYDVRQPLNTPIGFSPTHFSFL